MPLSSAAMEGIQANGLRWRHRIRLGQWPALLGKLNDRASDGEEIPDGEVEAAALKIVGILRAVVAREAWVAATDLARRADDLEMAAECGLEDVNDAMGELYDSLDYHRVLVERPR